MNLSELSIKFSNETLCTFHYDVTVGETLLTLTSHFYVPCYNMSSNKTKLLKRITLHSYTCTDSNLLHKDFLRTSHTQDDKGKYIEKNTILLSENGTLRTSDQPTVSVHRTPSIEFVPLMNKLSSFMSLYLNVMKVNRYQNKNILSICDDS